MSGGRGQRGGGGAAAGSGLRGDRGHDADLEPAVGGSREQGSGCCGLGAAEDARRVAAVLGIRHYVLDFQEIFYETVIRDYAAEYRAGRTPNPCIRCNEFVKFGAMLRRAEQLGARPRRHGALCARRL